MPSACKLVNHASPVGIATFRQGRDFRSRNRLHRRTQNVGVPCEEIAVRGHEQSKLPTRIGLDHDDQRTRDQNRDIVEYTASPEQSECSASTSRYSGS